MAHRPPQTMGATGLRPAGTAIGTPQCAPPTAAPAMAVGGAAGLAHGRRHRGPAAKLRTTTRPCAPWQVPAHQAPHPAQPWDGANGHRRRRPLRRGAKQVTTVVPLTHTHTHVTKCGPCGGKSGRLVEPQVPREYPIVGFQARAQAWPKTAPPRRRIHGASVQLLPKHLARALVSRRVS